MNRALNPDDLLRLRFICDGRIAPDGKSVAYVLSHAAVGKASDVWEIRLRDLGSGTEKHISDDVAPSSPRWSPDGTRLAFIKAEAQRHALGLISVQDGTSRSIDIPGGGLHSAPAWSADGKKIAVVIGTRAPDPDCRRITTRQYRSEGLGFTDSISQKLCLIDAVSGAISTLVEGSGVYSNLEWDAAGERILFLRTSLPEPFDRYYSPHLYTVRIADRTVHEHLGTGWSIQFASWVPGEKRFAIVGAYKGSVTIPTPDLWVVDEDGANASCRSTHVKGRVGFRIHHDMPMWGMGSGLVVKDKTSAWVTVQTGGSPEVWQMTLSGPVRCERVVGGERCCMLLNASADKSSLLFAATDPRTPPDLFLFDGKAQRRLTEVNREVLSGWPTLRHQNLKFRSADGLELEGWYVADASKTGPLPTVMFIHGGPWLGVGNAYRFDFHMLASHGIGVLFANFRGSFGYGEEFARGIMGKWGELGFPDHMAAVDHAIKAGLADSKRLGVWGHSHGGFATCWVIGHTERFRAAVAEAPVTDFTTLYYTTDAPDYFSYDMGGKPHEMPEVYRSRSPMTYAHRCKTATLFIHPEKDLRCPISESEQFYRVLLDVGCAAELVRLRDVNHMGYAVGPPPVRVGQRTALLEWFKKHL